MLRNCRNCGAVMVKPVCPYCGTRHRSDDDLVNLLQGRTVHIWFEDDEGNMEMLDAHVHSTEQRREFATFYSDGAPVVSVPTSHDMTIEACVLPFDRDVWQKEGLL